MRTCSLCRRKGTAEFSIRVGFYSDHQPENGWPETLGNNFKEDDEVRAPVCHHCLDEVAHEIGCHESLLSSLVESLLTIGGLKEIEEKKSALLGWISWHDQEDSRTLEMAEKVLGVELLKRTIL